MTPTHAPMNSQCRSRRGMTLLELVVAITILAMMAIAGTVAFGTVIDQQETIRTAASDVERAAALRETIRQWILQGEPQVQVGGGPNGGSRTLQVSRASSRSMLVPSALGSSGAASVTSAALTGNELTVVTNGPNPLMAPAVRIRVFVDADDNTPEQGLTIEYQGATPQSPLLRRQLDGSVGDLYVEFFDQRSGRWLASTEASTGQPIALRISMFAAEGYVLPRLLELPLTIVFGEPTP